MRLVVTEFLTLDGVMEALQLVESRSFASSIVLMEYQSQRG